MVVVEVVRLLPIGFVQIHRDEFGAGIGHRSVNRQSMKTLTLIFVSIRGIWQ